MHVAIVALGPSSHSYVTMMEGLGGRHAFCDEVWAVNSYGDVLACDRIFHMDDVRIQEQRAVNNPKIGSMLAGLKATAIPVYTSRRHPDYPATTDYPLEDVINAVGTDYFNCTPSYAIAYAIYLGAKRISLFGLDFTWPNASDAEQGRACCEYWIGRAMQRGIDVFVVNTSSLMDANVERNLRHYGYDTLDVEVSFDGGKAKVTTTPRDSIPDAAEIERRYDHTRGTKT
jgi:hypothetical protein